MRTVRPCQPPACRSSCVSERKRRFENSVPKSPCTLAAASRLEGDKPWISSEAPMRPNGAPITKTRIQSGKPTRNSIGACIDAIDANAAILIELYDAVLLWADGKKMRMRGFEDIDNVQYGQTWEIEVA